MFARPPLTPFVRAALITLAASFIASAILTNFLGVPIQGWLALDVSQLSPLLLLQLFSYVLVYPIASGQLLGFAITLLFFWWIVAPFEARHGLRRVLELSLAATVVPAIAALGVGQLTPGYGALYGTGCIVLATLCADAALLPEHAELSFFGLFPMRPQQLLYLAVAWSVLNFLLSKSTIFLAADLAAIGTGYAFARYWMLRVPRRRGPTRSSKRPPGRARGLRLVRSDDDDDDNEPKSWLN